MMTNAEQEDFDLVLDLLEEIRLQGYVQEALSRYAGESELCRKWIRQCDCILLKYRVKDEGTA